MRPAIAIFLCLVGLSMLAAEPLHVELDKLIAAKAVGPIAPRSDDAEFFRRVKLDLNGQVPSVSETRVFLKDTSAKKRSKLIDQLLNNDVFAEHWTDRLSVMLLERQNLGKITDGEWRKFLVNTLKGKPRWDVMAKEMVEAKGLGESRPAMKFLGTADHHKMTENIARLFLGMDLKCAKCHDHPSVDEWKQAHYWGLYSYLNQTKNATNSKDKQAYLVEGVATKKVDFQSVFKMEKENTGPRLPGSKEVAIPIFEKGKEFEKSAAEGLPGVPKFRPRELLARDLTSKDNTYFVRNGVNRIWYLMMGRGLAHPLDEVHGQNPPSHPKLMELLMYEFAAQDFDVKWLVREIALSESYQRSSRLPKDVKDISAESYRTAHPKAMTPEQLLRVVLKATGNEARVHALVARKDAEKFDRRGYFTGTNLEMPPSYEEIRALWLLTYAEPAGMPEVDFLPGLNKALFLMNDRMIQDWLKPQKGNLIERLTKFKTPKQISEEMYLSMLARMPQPEEIETVKGYLEANKNRRTEALGDLTWSLLTSTEFRLNH
ncbi:MAG: DUF1553 domain-containing protein [Verrucomicrobiota bacterium]|nr:DUF1553 domain-containing protein [Verrucomicrobiota bacterium]